ncbi:MAG TPA: amidohydrolase family protein, partial [Armatimonadota bacterium]|nr:amidohydrolase family protein [Armatimonadota bacterium]
HLGHFGPWAETLVPHALDDARVIAEMDRYGCDMVWMSTSNPGYAADLRTKNDDVLGFAARYPDRIIPYCTLSAHTPERNLAELQRCLDHGRCIGVKMHVYRQPAYSLRSDFLQPVLERLNAHRLVYLNHTFTSVPDLEWALRRYPEITFIGGHFSPGWHDLAVRYPNMRGCTCAAMAPESITHEYARLGRSDVMLVGSDFSLFQLGFGLGMVAYADIPEAAKADILGGNAIRLMERTGWFTRGMIRK